MSHISTCPDIGDLQKFLLGRGSEAEAGELERHLGGCDPCLRAAQKLLAEDSAPRAPAPAEAAPRRDAVRRLTERLEGPGQARPDSGGDGALATVTPSAAGGNTSSGTPALHAAPTAALNAAAADARYDFLAPAERPDEIGRLGPYRVLKTLGAGGMGVVFQAEDPHLERPVALKAMLPSLVGGTAKQRFLREARTAASVKHDHVVVIHQVGEDRGVPFLAMEFLEGQSLEDRLRREGRLPLPEVLRIGREMAEGLAAAHRRGLIHRDVKPANIWLEGDRGRVKILDFGLARAAADAAHLTQSGAIVGTPAYMAPEQARSEQVDHRADLFSLGCVLYRMATGEPAFKGKNTLAILASVGLDEPPPPRELDPTIPSGFSDLVMQLLVKKPENRPASAAEVIQTLEAIERGLAASPSPDWESGAQGSPFHRPRVAFPSPRPPAQTVKTPNAGSALRPRASLLFIGGALAGALLVGVAAFLLLRGQEPEKVRPPNDAAESTAADKGNTGVVGPNTLTAAESAAGWRLLFDGKTGSGWLPFNTFDRPIGYVVEPADACITLTEDQYLLRTEEEFGDFELALEWRVPPKGNGGVQYRATQTGVGHSKSALTMQAVDNSAIPYCPAGTLWPLYPAPPEAARPVGLWNEGRILARGKHIEHWLNDNKVVQFDIGSPDFEARLKAYRNDFMTDDFARSPRGYVVLKRWDGAVSFRSIKIRPLTGK